MKNMIGFLKKTPLRFNPFLLLLSLFVSFLITPSYANSEFNISVDFQHTLLEENVNTKAIMTISSDTSRVITFYTATIPLENLRVTCQNFKTGQNLECTTFYRGSTTDILINLDNTVVKPDLPLEIALEYQTTNSEKSSYNLPSEILDTTTNSVLVKYPKDMGEPLWSSDPISSVKGVGDNLEVLILKPNFSKISILFGKQLLYKFEITKVFSNSLNDENQTFELYVPSDTPTQTVIWEEISPLPDNALKDEDGNYVFKYIVAPNETIDCNISGYIQKTENIESQDTISPFLTQETGYWAINNSTEIRRINTFLSRKGIDIQSDFDNVENLDESQRELFYKYLYQYVLDRLSLKEDVSLGIGIDSRVGADTLMENPNNASSLDYGDFYIALLREYNVPSRLVVGYISNITGYSSDGFYHHWVEYYDLNTKKWITADPFLEEYFEKSLFGSTFLDHIVILRRGKSAVAPKMSFFQETDFIVRAETQESKEVNFNINAEFVIEKFNKTDPYVKGLLNISNTGNVAVNNYTISKSNIDNIISYIDPVNNLQSQIVLPNENKSIQFNIPYEEINSSNIFVTVLFENIQRYELEKTIESDAVEIVPMYLSILSKLLSVVIFGAIVFLIYFLTMKFNKKLFNKKKNE